MIFKGDAGAGQGDLNGFLDRGSHVQGELRFENSFRVDGKITGSVASTGTLIVGDGGEVEGDVAVGRLLVSGVVRGSVKATGKIQVAPGGKVFADLMTPSLVIEDGAVFEGRCSMTGEPRGVERSERSERGEKMGEAAAAEASKPQLVPRAAG